MTRLRSRASARLKFRGVAKRRANAFPHCRGHGHHEQQPTGAMEQPVSSLVSAKSAGSSPGGEVWPSDTVHSCETAAPKLPVGYKAAASHREARA